MNVKTWAEVLADNTDISVPEWGDAVCCPFCGSDDVARYQYGLPVMSKDLEERMAAGKIVLGGCCITPFDPSHKCNECGKSWSEIIRVIESIAYRLHVTDVKKFLDSGVQRAFRFASKAHAGQTDKLGEPYIYHPFSVAAKLDTPNELMAALLHDVVEDTDTTFDDLRFFPSEVVVAVGLLDTAAA